MDVLQQIAALVGIGFIGARQTDKRWAEFSRGLQIEFVLAAAVAVHAPP